MKLLPLQFAALAVAQSATINDTPTTAPTATPTPTPKTFPTFEIDVIYPKSNGSYNFTDTFPIVFAFQNFSAAIAGLPKVHFMWDIMPWGTHEHHMPALITTDMRYYWHRNPMTDDGLYRAPNGDGGNRKDLMMDDYNNFTNADGSPYILVESSNTKTWQRGPAWFGTLYALQWYVSWEDESGCSIHTEMPYHILFEARFNDPGWPKNLPIGPNPEDLSDITNSTCAQFGSIGEIDEDEKDACSKYKQLPAERGNPCAVALDANRVKSISSRAAHLATMTPVTSTQSETRSSANYAATVVPKPHAILALGLLGGMPLLI